VLVAASEASHLPAPTLRSDEAVNVFRAEGPFSSDEGADNFPSEGVLDEGGGCDSEEL
jgi:hypothetical protein